MMTLRVDSNIDQAIRGTKATAEQVRKAAVLALNRVAYQAQSELRVEMTRVFDRPTEYALNATRVIQATESRPTAQVWLKNRSGQPAQDEVSFLYPEVFGTPRGRKAFETRLLRVGWLRSNEFLVPAQGLPLDPNGNVPNGMIRSILSQAGAAGGLGYTSNKTTSKRSKATVRKRGAFFVPDRNSTLPRGIYQRIDFATGTRTMKYTTAKGKQRTRNVTTYGRNAIRMVFKIVIGKPRYKPRLRMFELGERILRRDFDREFARALQQVTR